MVQLRFELGDSQAPRGHAIIYARSGGPTGPLLATYCVVLPIAFSISKYLPPMFAGQFPTEALRDTTTSVVPIPPMLEDAPSIAALHQLAERRGDDLCDLGTLLLTDDTQRLNYAAEAAAAYGQLMTSYTHSWPAVADEVVASGAVAALDDLDVDSVLAEVLSDRDRLAELARSMGTLRYATEGHDKALAQQTERKMRRMASGLAEKYRADQLIEAALASDERGAQLAQLYLQRAYKLADEDYAAIPPLERDIRELRGQVE